jgi:hypothetical protein
MFKPLLVSSLLLVSALADPPEIAGRWRWNVRGGDGEGRPVNVTLKQEGEKVTGTMRAFGNPTEIEDGKVTEEGDVSFAIRRRNNNRVFESKYTGKFVDGKITGKIESVRDGETRTSDWNATRFAKVNEHFTGEWKATIKRPDGGDTEHLLDIKQSDEKIAGVSKLANGTESPIVSGEAKDKEANFTVKRDRDGRVLIFDYKGKLDGDDKIAGQVVSNFGNETRTFDFSAVRIK